MGHHVPEGVEEAIENGNEGEKESKVEGRQEPASSKDYLLN
jgi:hypothetical protein